MAEKVDSVKSPCVGKCKLNDDRRCVGCGRTIEQIQKWSSFSYGEKMDVLKMVVIVGRDGGRKSGN
jgi:predicted Fe-S protein YdhL (DUF1289 family)